MVNRWLRTNSLLAATSAFWLVALSPIPPIGKAVSYSLAMFSGVQLIQETRRLIRQDATRIALDVMNQDLEQLQIALHTHAQEIALTESYSPEVKQELTTALEHLYNEPSADESAETSASTSDKSYYLAIKSLLEIRGETFVIEEVLKLGGRNWGKGKEILQQILEEGDRNGWDKK